MKDHQPARNSEQVLTFLIKAQRLGSPTNPRVKYRVSQHMDDEYHRMEGEDIWSSEGESFVMRFKLEDRTGLILVFAADPFWVQEGTICPTTEIYNQNFEVIKNDNCSIDVLNYNCEKKDYKYSLQIVDDSTPPRPYPCDPTIQNGGGGQNFICQRILAGKES